MVFRFTDRVMLTVKVRRPRCCTGCGCHVVTRDVGCFVWTVERRRRMFGVRPSLSRCAGGALRDTVSIPTGVAGDVRFPAVRLHSKMHP
jgi:hypothetical protein